jgi:hypothetical protein
VVAARNRKTLLIEFSAFCEVRLLVDRAAFVEKAAFVLTIKRALTSEYFDQ